MQKIYTYLPCQQKARYRWIMYISVKKTDQIPSNSFPFIVNAMPENSVHRINIKRKKEIEVSCEVIQPYSNYYSDLLDGNWNKINLLVAASEFITCNCSELMSRREIFSQMHVSYAQLRDMRKLQSCICNQRHGAPLTFACIGSIDAI